MPEEKTDTVASCACATVARPASKGAHSSAGRRPRRRTRAGEDTRLSEEEASWRVSERRPADAEDSGGEASGREQSRAEDAGEAIRQSGNPAIRQSGNPAIRQSGNPAIRQSGNYSEGSPLRPCQPLCGTIFRAPGGGRKRCAQRADRMSSFVEDGHRDLSEPVARLAGAHSAHICRASPVPFGVPYAEHAAKASQPRARKSARTCVHQTTRCLCRYRPPQSRRPQPRYRA